MCGIEILLCCAAGGAAGCCAKHKLDKAGKTKSGKVVKGDGEVIKRNAAAKENRHSKGKKSSPGKKAEQPKHRLPAYEEYQARYAAKPISKDHSQDSALHRRSAQPESPKGGQMDAEEFSRLKQAQRKEGLNKLR